MKAALAAIHEELKRLRNTGTKQVFVSEAAWTTLTESAPRPAGDGSAQSDTSRPRAAADASTRTPAASLPVAPSKSTRKETSQRETSKTRPIPESPPSVQIPAGDPATRLEKLKKQVEACPVCNERLEPDGKIVFGAGSPEAELLFCGEAPGAEEAACGEPFVGKAGHKLDQIIKAMGLDRESVYIANILKWRPEHDKSFGNRPPTPEEMRFCLPYLHAQIEIIQPKVVVALGKTAVDGLLGHDPARKMGRIRGVWHSFSDIPLMVTFHPSYILRNDTLKTKRRVWEDMLAVMEQLSLPISEKQRRYFL
ncbi:MAG: uracil-DNA glycosylase family protein [Opitutales bacterium]